MTPMDGELVTVWAQRGAAILACAALVSVLLIVVLLPLLQRYALARPNVRSSHQRPTPQGGGIAVIAATIAVTYGASYFLAVGAANAIALPIVFAAVILIACIGALADIQPIDVAPRLLMQMLAVAAVIFALPAELRVIPSPMKEQRQCHSPFPSGSGGRGGQRCPNAYSRRDGETGSGHR